MDDLLRKGFRLGEVRVSPLEGWIENPAGVEHVQPKVMDVLLCLARRPGEVVERDSLLDEVWGGRPTTDDVLTRCVSELRHVLGDRPGKPGYVQTIPKRGYRLLVEPTTSDGSAIATQQPFEDRTSFINRLFRHGVVQAGGAYLFTGWILVQIAEATFDNLGLPVWSAQLVTFTVIGGFPIVVLLAWFLERTNGRIVRDSGDQAGGILEGLERNYLAIITAYVVAGAGAGFYQYGIGFKSFEQPPIPVEPNSIAILKLANIDGSDRTKVFSEGLGDDLIDQLARVPGLLVSARGDSWSIPLEEQNSKNVRRRLFVAYYVEGRVLLEAETISVVIQLIDSENGFHLLSRRFEHPLQDFSQMRRDIADLIVDNLRPALPGDVIELRPGDYEDADPGAYELFRRGKSIVDGLSDTASTDDAIVLFRQSLEIDPGYPPAFAGICMALVQEYRTELDDAIMADADRACVDAQIAGDGVGVVQFALGEYYGAKGEMGKAEQAYLTALKLNDKDVNAMRRLADVYRRNERHEEAESLLQHAIELQPGNWRTVNYLGNLNFWQGKFAEAIKAYQIVLYLNPTHSTALGNMGSAWLMQGEFLRAQEYLQASVQIEENANFFSNLGAAYYYLGSFEKAADSYYSAIALSPEADYAWSNWADALYQSDDVETALEAYGKAAGLSRDRLRVNQNDAEALYLLAWSEAMLGNQAAAQDHIARSIEMDDGGAYTHLYDSLIKLHFGYTRAAEDALSRAIELGVSTRMVLAEPRFRALAGSRRFDALVAEKTDQETGR